MIETAKQLDPMTDFFFNEMNQPETTENTETTSEATSETTENTEETPVVVTATTETEPVKTEEEKQAEQVIINKWEDSITDPKARWIAEQLAKENGDEEVYNALKDKFEYKSYSDDKKIIAYLAAENPELDENELLFLAGQQYGIGVEIDGEEELTTEEKQALKIRDIARKKAVSEADRFFRERAQSITLPELPNPLDNDEGYKGYLSWQEQQEQNKQAIIAQQEQETKLLETLDASAKALDKLDIDLKFDMDGGEFVIKSDFKLDEKKKSELAEFVKVYQPTEAQVKAHTKGDVFDFEKYVGTIAKMYFSDQITKAAVKQALSKDREQFIEKGLYNSNLRNNDINENQPVVQEPWEFLMGRS